LAAALAVLAPGAARASGLDAPWVTSGASGPTTADAAAVYWNPAALAGVQRTELMLGGALVLGHVTYTRQRFGTYQTPDTLQFKTPIDPANVDPARTGAYGTVSADPFSPIGNLFFALPVLAKKLTLGGGFYVPYAAALDYPPNGAQRWQLQSAFIVATNVTASAAYQITPALSVGAGVSYVGGLAEFVKVQDFAGLAEIRDGFASPNIRQENDFGPNAPTEVRELNTLSRRFSFTRGLSNGVTFNAGLAYSPAPRLKLGLVYQHGASMNYKGKFALDMNDPFFTSDLAEQGLRYKPLVAGDASLKFSLPKRLTLGAQYALNDRLTLDGFFSYIFYSDFRAFVVETSSPDLAQPELGIGERVTVRLPRNWRNTVWAQAGARYKLSRTLTATGFVGYQSPASPDSTIDTASPDGHRLLGDVGAILALSETMSLSGDFRLQGILPRTVEPGADGKGGSDHDLGNGRYTLLIAALGGHLKILF
ncbi:MAG TPA: outer membrane protein transport protein, partial [Polyangiaceae bacterium]|nr:outer membrane protein transport protein [Polyangiaceae bacterium]